MMKLFFFVILYGFFVISLTKQKKKDPRDFTEADLHRLDEQWTEDGEIDDGDLPEHLRPSEPLDMSKLDPSKPEEMLKMSKRHKTLMMFATISGDPTQEETEEITSLWQSMLYNANIEITRFVISPNRILIKIADGSYAYEIKDFLIKQERCETVTIEGRDYPGKGSKKAKETNKEAKKKKSKSGQKKQEL